MPTIPATNQTPTLPAWLAASALFFSALWPTANANGQPHATALAQAAAPQLTDEQVKARYQSHF